MNDERIDAETLAAFLDGRLDPADRSRVLRVLAAHPEEYEGFSDAAHVTAALADSSVVPISAGRRKRGRWVVAIPALIAAGIAAVVVLPRLGRGGGLSPQELAGHLSLGPGSLSTRLGADWDQPGWTVTRGGGAELPEPARAFRLGTRATDVEIALLAEDTLALQQAGAELVELASGIDGGAGSAAQYRRLVAQGLSAGDADRRDAVQDLRALTGGSPWFDLGAWAEAVRVGAASADLTFLTRSRRPLDALIKRIEARPSTEGAPVLELLRELRTMLESARETDLERIEERVSRVMATTGR
jgi:hypothetical protein